MYNFCCVYIFIVITIVRFIIKPNRKLWYMLQPAGCWSLIETARYLIDEGPT
jgi:hypothetical protein